MLLASPVGYCLIMLNLHWALNYCSWALDHRRNSDIALPCPSPSVHGRPHPVGHWACTQCSPSSADDAWRLPQPDSNPPPAADTHDLPLPHLLQWEDVWLPHGIVVCGQQAMYRCFHDWGVMEFWWDANNIQSDNRKFQLRLLVGKNCTDTIGRTYVHDDSCKPCPMHLALYTCMDGFTHPWPVITI